MKGLATRAVTAVIFTIIGSGGIMYGQGSASEEFSITKPAASHQAISVENTNGSIEIVGVEGLSEVRISGEMRVRAQLGGNAEEHLSDISINVDESGSTLAVKTVQPNGRLFNYQVDYTIQVPASWEVKARNTNGNVEVRGIRNNVTANVVNGSIETREIEGELHGEVTNGQIDGNVTVPANGTCVLRTVNGQIAGKVSMASNATLKAGATNGQISLSLPRSTSASVAADVSIGDVSLSGLSLESMTRSRKGFTGETVAGTLGSGGGTIDLSVTTGSIALEGE